MELLTPGGAAYQGRNYEPHDESCASLSPGFPMISSRSCARPRNLISSRARLELAVHTVCEYARV